MRGFENSQKVAQYALLPGIIPRLRSAFDLSFSILATLFAQCFAMARLLPAHHPYLRADSFGTYSTIQVFRAAQRELIFDLRHLDQIIMYFVVMIGFVLFLVMFGLTTLYALTAPAHAAGYGSTFSYSVSGLISEVSSFFVTQHPEHDLALMLLDRVLGIHGNTSSGSFFGSDVPNMCGGLTLGEDTCTTPESFPSPYQEATLSLLGFYSMAILFFAMFILFYFITILVLESSMTGVPFGKHFNRFWGPLRLVAAIGMLIPVGPHGLNSSQYIILYTAKFSSAFATNAWLYYNQFVNDSSITGASMNPVGVERDYEWDPTYGDSVPETSPLAGRLSAPDMGDLVRYLHLVATCEYYYERIQPNTNVQGYFVNATGSIPAYDEPTASSQSVSFQSYEDALTFFNNKNIVITFGIKDDVKYASHQGSVLPLCGKLIIPVTSINAPGAASINKEFYNMLMALWNKNYPARQWMDGFASMMVENYAKLDNQNRCRWDTDNDHILNDPISGNNLTQLGDCRYDPPRSYLEAQVALFQSIFRDRVTDANTELANPDNFIMSLTMLDRGWAGAGIWFRHIAVLNGDFVSSVQQIPYGSELPNVMNKALGMQQASSASMQQTLRFMNLNTTQNSALAPEDAELAKALDGTYRFLYSESARFSFFPDANGPQNNASGANGYEIDQPNKQNNPVIDAINIVLGTEFLFSFRDNQETNPLAQLVTFGRVLLERSVRNLMTGSTIATMGGIISVGNNDMGSALRNTSQFFNATASMFFIAGFYLFYILPMLPFIYFFFAMLAWVKAIFEGLIGAPLWALSHLRLQGDGFPSGHAQIGYKLLLEILFRPIITVFGLVCAIGIFSAMMYTLNDLYNVAVSIITGYNRTDFQGVGSGTLNYDNIRGVADKFLTNIVYILLSYMLANSCFKLIDSIPNSFMRWLGSNPKSFATLSFQRDHPAGHFSGQIGFVVAYPMQGQIDQLDDNAFMLSRAAAEAANDATKSAAVPEGQVAQLVRELVGRDNDTFVRETLDDMVSAQATHTQKAQALQAQAANLEKSNPNKAKDLAKQAQEEMEQAHINDPMRLLQERKKSGSGLSTSERSRASENLKKIDGILSVSEGDPSGLVTALQKNKGLLKNKDNGE